MTKAYDILRERAARFLQKTVLDNPYIPVEPTIQQAKFLLLPHREAFYGGAAGGGKTYAQLMAALQFVQTPNYNALILRKTYPMLKRADSPITISLEWLSGTDARYNSQEHRWTFPSGATMEFGHLQYENDRFNYQGPSYHYIGFDEVTHFLRKEYIYLLSRLRKAMKLKGIPLRMRASANPGGRGHEWVKQRFLTEGAQYGRPFVPAKMEDNPHLDVEDYKLSLMELEPHERLQLQHGDWETTIPGDIFREEFFEDCYLDPGELPRHMTMVRYWDLAATDPSKKAKKSGDPDYTAGAKLGYADPYYIILDVRDKRLDEMERDAWMRRTAKQDGEAVSIWIEQDPGQAGKSQVSNMARTTFREFNLRPWPKTGANSSKLAYWGILASKWAAGLVKMVRAPWNTHVENHLKALKRDDSHDHDDIADAIAGGLKVLLAGEGTESSWGIPEDVLDEIDERSGDREIWDIDDLDDWEGDDGDETTRAQDMGLGILTP